MLNACAPTARRRIFIELKPEDDEELGSVVPALGAVLGSWLGAWPMPLDWGMEWQAWPVGCTVMAVGGYIVGAVLALPVAQHLRKQRRNGM